MITASSCVAGGSRSSCVRRCHRHSIVQCFMHVFVILRCIYVTFARFISRYHYICTLIWCLWYSVSVQASHCGHLLTFEACPQMLVLKILRILWKQKTWWKVRKMVIGRGIELRQSKAKGNSVVIWNVLEKHNCSSTPAFAHICYFYTLLLYSLDQPVSWLENAEKYLVSLRVFGVVKNLW